MTDTTNPTPDQGDERRAFDLYWLARQRQRGFGAALTDAEMLSHPEDRADEFLAWQAARALPAAGVSIEEYRRVVSRCIELGEKIAALSVVQPVAQEAINQIMQLVDDYGHVCAASVTAPSVDAGDTSKEYKAIESALTAALSSATPAGEGLREKLKAHAQEHFGILGDADDVCRWLDDALAASPVPLSDSGAQEAITWSPAGYNKELAVDATGKVRGEVCEHSIDPRWDARTNDARLGEYLNRDQAKAAVLAALATHHHPASAEAGKGVSVPVEPTKEMVKAARDAAWPVSEDLLIKGFKAMLAASRSGSVAVSGEVSDTLALLVECRDAFPVPPPGSPLEQAWAQAMGEPECIPDYLRAAVLALAGSGGKA